MLDLNRLLERSTASAVGGGRDDSWCAQRAKVWAKVYSPKLVAATLSVGQLQAATARVLAGRTLLAGDGAVGFRPVYDFF
jgi:hypothetical protein